MPSDLVGRTAIVTGGARGIGESIVQRLAEAGCNVVINCNTSVDAAEALAETVRAGGGGAEVVAGSIADPTTGPALAACALERFGQIDILVNNAGINRDVTIRKMTDEDFTEVIETNLTGTHRVTKAVIEPMCAAGFGRVISISSFVGQLGNYGQSNYAATKGGLIAWTKTVAYEVARHGVTVNCICPGFIDTDMLRGVSDDVRERLKTRIPLGRFGESDEIARAVVYLARDGDYITGSSLNVNGGIFM
jgi:NAD(P)-dependent dehydrogenase (short-subunit alcohol dehydrogenase family)